MSKRIDGSGGGQGGARDYFTEGRGRGFDIPERKELPVTNEARTKAIEIDLGDLNQPGKGPVNFEPAKGWDLDQPLRKGGSDGDSDGDINVA
jgi:hypothetical protein